MLFKLLKRLLLKALEVSIFLLKGLILGAEGVERASRSKVDAAGYECSISTESDQNLCDLDSDKGPKENIWGDDFDPIHNIHAP